MGEFLTWLQIPSVQIVGWTLGALGWVVGLVSGVIQVKGYSKQRNFEGAYQTLLEDAQRDWRARYTEEQVRDLTEQFDHLQSKIANDVPRQAKRVFLEDQLDALNETIGQSYERYAKLASQLRSQTGGSVDDLPAAIKHSIEEAILPSYLVRQRRQTLLYWLTAGIFLLSFMPIVVWLLLLPLYYPIRIGTFEYPILIFLAFSFVTVATTYAARKLWCAHLDHWISRHRVALWVTRIGSWLVALPALFVFFVVSSEWRPGPWGPVWYEGLLAAISAGGIASAAILTAMSPCSRGTTNDAAPNMYTMRRPTLR